MKRRSLFVTLTLVLLTALVGCGNPADDKPEAKVGEVAPEHAAPSDGTRLVLTDASTVGFVGSKITGSHTGGFNSFDGTFILVDGDPTRSKIEVTIDTNSLWADDDRLAGHLKSADFFDVEKYGTATFTSTKIVKDGTGYTVTGNLDLHGVTKSIEFPATIAVAGDRVTAQAEFVIQRFDFGIEYKGKADDLIRDEVVVKLNVVAAPEAATGT